MKWMKKKPQGEEVSYWQTISDIMTALLLIIMLVVMLLILYVTRVPENDNIDPDVGNTMAATTAHIWDDGHGGWNGDGQPSPSWTPTASPTPTHYDDNHGGGGGRDGWNTVHPTDTPSPTYDAFDGVDKAAVYVMVVDAVTQRTIKEADVTFNLFGADGEVQQLSTYYPNRIVYRDFATTESGVFYLPEKMSFGKYTLHELTEPEGYDAAANLTFTIDKPYDWEDPYVVKVELYPSRNVVQINAKDSANGRPVAGGLYDVIAQENIMTDDGTLRYTAGETVAQFTCDENGHGESDELYLGQYMVVQRTAPEYYALVLDPIEVTIGKKNDRITTVLPTFACERTTFELTIADELYNNIPMAEVNLLMTTSTVDEPVTVTTNAEGRLMLNQLTKDTTYHLKQLTSLEGYTFPAETIDFTVSHDGRIGDDAHAAYIRTNRTIRATVAVKDILLRKTVADYNLALYDESGELLKVWNSTGVAEALDHIIPGKYRVVVARDGGDGMEITVQDIADVQPFDCLVWTNASIGGIAGAGIILLALIILLVFSLKRKH